MNQKESPHAGGPSISTEMNFNTTGKNILNIFAGSLEEQARQRWEQRHQSNPPPRRRTYMNLRRLVYTNHDNPSELARKARKFATAHDLPIGKVRLVVRSILAEKQEQTTLRGRNHG